MANRIKRRSARLARAASGLIIERQLALFGHTQHRRFEAASAGFQRLYDSVRTLEPIGGLLTAQWGSYLGRCEEELLPHPPFNFLRLPVIAETMFVDNREDWLDREIEYLEQVLRPAELTRVLHEDSVGAPRVAAPRYRTSHNSVHHLFHLLRYSEAKAVDLASCRSVVEWGGGYGNLAKLYRRLVGTDHSYVIVDVPIFSVLQFVYLTSVGIDVRLVTPAAKEIDPGVVNLVPLTLLSAVDIEADLFISTWGLSESSAEAQHEVTSRGWFGASRRLIAFQEHAHWPEAARLRDRLIHESFEIHPIPFLPGNFYAFS